MFIYNTYIHIYIYIFIIRELEYRIPRLHSPRRLPEVSRDFRTFM